MNNSEYKEYLKSKKWRDIASDRIIIDGLHCQFCGCEGTKGNPLEVHHLSYKHLGNEENRKYEDLVTLCHACHKGVHRMMNRVTSENGRRGWSDNPNIPKVQVVNYSGDQEDVGYIVVGEERG